MFKTYHNNLYFLHGNFFYQGLSTLSWCNCSYTTFIMIWVGDPRFKGIFFITFSSHHPWPKLESNISLVFPKYHHLSHFTDHKAFCILKIVVGWSFIGLFSKISLASNILPFLLVPFSASATEWNGTLLGSGTQAEAQGADVGWIQDVFWKPLLWSVVW